MICTRGTCKAHEGLPLCYHNPMRDTDHTLDKDKDDGFSASLIHTRAVILVLVLVRVHYPI